MRKIPSLRAFAAATILAVTVGVAGAAAQAPITPPMRIGLILPEVTPGTGVLDTALARAAEQGARMGGDEARDNAAMLDITVEILTERATGPEAAVAAAARLVEQGAFGVIGGYDFAEAHALGEWADTAGIPFVNVGATEDSLRNELCSTNMFHIEASAAMYLDALAGWYVRAGFRRWYIIQEDTADGEALHDRLTWTLENRHFGVREVGRLLVPEGATITADMIDDIEGERPDLILMLTDAADQLTAVQALDAGGIDVEVAGYPYPDAQTRTFYAAYRQAAPNLGAGHRASNWEWTIDAYGAREYNARYSDQFGEPMDEMAWGTFHAVKVLFEAAFFGQSTNPADVMAYLVSPTSVFDLHKGIAVSFRPWDRQIRQSLFLVKLSDDINADPFTIALLVGELPAIYMPGTDPIERLDQLGDLADHSTCDR